MLEIGFLGSHDGKEALTEIQKLVSVVLEEQDVAPAWELPQYRSSQLEEISRTEESCFIPAGAGGIDTSEVELAKLLEDSETRGLITIRGAGSMLASDLAKKAKASNVEEQINLMTTAGLLAQEHVVICKRTLNQTNRFNSKARIERAAELVLLCQILLWPLAGDEGTAIVQ